MPKNVWLTTVGEPVKVGDGSVHSDLVEMELLAHHVQPVDDESVWNIVNASHLQNIHTIHSNTNQHHHVHTHTHTRTKCVNITTHTNIHTHTHTHTHTHLRWPRNGERKQILGMVCSLRRRLSWMSLASSGSWRATVAKSSSIMANAVGDGGWLVGWWKFFMFCVCVSNGHWQRPQRIDKIWILRKRLTFENTIGGDGEAQSEVNGTKSSSARQASVDGVVYPRGLGEMGRTTHALCGCVCVCVWCGVLWRNFSVQRSKEKKKKEAVAAPKTQNSKVARKHQSMVLG